MRTLAVVSVFVASVILADEEKRPVNGIRDNSFLVEEAYNQEKGVVQHIFTADYRLDHASGRENDLWALAFTQEWPVFSQTHQLSYTVPYYFSRIEGRDGNGFGDVLLNYRWQAFFDERTLTAFAPRASLILPTGDADLGFSEDTPGAQVNLPFSRAIGDRWFVHLNAGATWLPEAFSAHNHHLLHYNLGASAIYAATDEIHLMLEWVGGWIETRSSAGGREHNFAAVLSPGLRKAFNFESGAQLVLGLAAPIGLNRYAPDYGAFVYVSFEHFFSRQ